MFVHEGKTYAVQPGREVILSAGRAYFEVLRNPGHGCLNILICDQDTSGYKLSRRISLTVRTMTADVTYK